MSSFFRVAKNDSATALSKQSHASPSRQRCRRRAPSGRRQARRIAILVGVVDEASFGLAAGQRHLKRVEDELRSHVLGHRPPTIRREKGVLDGGEIDPSSQLRR